jgi:hypothetical protein
MSGVLEGVFIFIALREGKSLAYVYFEEEPDAREQVV